MESQSILAHLPDSFFVAVALLIGLMIEVATKRDQVPALLSLVVYFTIGLWYFADVFIAPQTYVEIDPSVLAAAYWEVIVFLGAYRLLSEIVLQPDHPTRVSWGQSAVHRFPVRPTLAVILPLWGVLLVIGFSRMNWDMLGSLFPMGGRNAPHMWSRGALGGSTDFLVSTAGYTYSFICGLFGVLLLLSRTAAQRFLLLGVILLSWPSFFLLGIRNQLLAVVMPMIFSYLFFSSAKIWKRIAVAVVSLLCLHYTMLGMLQMRNVGLKAFMESPFKSDEKELRHEGLNMIEELARINGFFQVGLLHLTYGKDYLAHVANVVPRAIWKNKPRISFEYSILRGQGQEKEGAPTATIATGLIGQGVINFGPWAGPCAAAFLMALYTGFLSRQWLPRRHPMRLILLFIGVALLPNLGREFTPLVLWPLIFGYAIVYYLERRMIESGVPAAIALARVRRMRHARVAKG